MSTRSYSAYTRTSPTQIIEHTPILDVPAYLASQKKAQTRKKILDTFAFLAILVIACILIKLGGAA